MVDKLVLDKDALAKMGLADTPIYVIEYDLHSPLKIDKKLNAEQKKKLKEYNKLAKEFRNRLYFLLRYKLKAFKHLESNWFIAQNSLEIAKEALNSLKMDMKAKGFADIDKRVRIIPILTTETVFESYEDKKVEYLLEFAFEHIKKLENAKKEKRMADSNLWLCKKAYEQLEALKMEIKNHKRFNEVNDSIQILADLIAQVEIMLQKQKEAQKGV